MEENKELSNQGLIFIICSVIVILKLLLTDTEVLLDDELPPAYVMYPLAYLFFTMLYMGAINLLDLVVSIVIRGIKSIRGEVMSVESMYLELLKNRNDLQLKALKRGHTFEEELLFGMNGLELQVAIGGEDMGVVMYSCNFDEGNMFKSIRDSLSDLIKKYDTCYTNIPKNR